MYEFGSCFIQYWRRSKLVHFSNFAMVLHQKLVEKLLQGVSASSMMLGFSLVPCCFMHYNLEAPFSTIILMPNSHPRSICTTIITVLNSHPRRPSLLCLIVNQGALPALASIISMPTTSTSSSPHHQQYASNQYQVQPQSSSVCKQPVPSLASIIISMQATSTKSSLYHHQYASNQYQVQPL